MAQQSEYGEGWRAWISVLAMWTRCFLWAGITKGLGTMSPTLQEQLQTNASTIGLITSAIFATSGTTGLFAGWFSRMFQPGTLIMISGLMIGAGVIVASFSFTPVQLAFAYTFLAATAAGSTGVVVKETVARSFHKNYASALGIARTGTAAGVFVVSPLTQLFLNTYGWRGTMLLTGAISLHFVVCGALMVAAKIGHTNNYQQLPEEDAYSAATRPNKLSSCCITFLKNTSSNLNFKLLLCPRYWAVAAIFYSTGYAYRTWIIYFVSMAQNTGFRPEDAANFVMFAGIGSSIARVAQGFIIDRGVIPHWVLMLIAIFLISLSICASPWLTSYWEMMTASALTLIGNGVLVCLNDIVAKQVMGVDLLAGTYGWIGISSAGISLGLGFLPGWLYDNNGSYTVAFVMMGCVQALALIPVVTLRYLQYIH